MTFVEKLDIFSEKHHRESGISGYLRVSLKDNIIYEKSIGYADEENRIPFDNSSMFSLYSLSKPFCAIGLLKLYDKGLLDIDAHPSKYLSEIKDVDKALTIRHILNHTSGLPDPELTPEIAERFKTGLPSEVRDQMSHLAEYPMLFSPGKFGKYANINFILTALIIENVSGMKYGDYMKKEIFEPLGMRCAVVDDGFITIPNRVKGYALCDGKKMHVQRAIDWMFGAGDIVATADDVYCLNKAVKHKLLLSEKTWEEALTPSSVNSMGFGCTVSIWHGKRRITHNGGHTGFRTLHIQLPEDDFDIIFLSNCGYGNARNEYSEAIYEAFFGENNSLSQEVKMDAGYI